MSKETVEAYKAFDQNFSCRGFKYEVGKTYKHDGNVKLRSSGFHACLEPFAVWSYYAATSRYAIVEASGEIKRDSDDSRIASAEITIKAELSLPEFISRGVKFILDRVDWKNAKESNKGYQSAATNTGDRSAATNTGDQSAATNTGDQSAATNTGNWSAATNTGDRSAATVEGKDSVALASGYRGKVSGADGCALFLVERDDNYKIIAAWAGIVGRDGIKANTFYTLKDGKPAESMQ